MTENRFSALPADPRSHFRLHLYAAVFCLIRSIHRMEAHGGEGLEQAFTRFPFLKGYLDQMRPFLPAGTTWSGATGWWERELRAWEDACPEHLPLRKLAIRASLTFEARLALMLVGMVEEDSRFGTLFADLQVPLGQRRPTLELAARVLGGDHFGEAFGVLRHLVTAGLVDAANPEAPRPEWELTVPGPLWDAIRGETAIHGLTWCEWVPPDRLPTLDALFVPADLKQRLSHLPGLVQAGRTRSVILRGRRGSGLREMAGALANGLGCGVLEVAGGALVADRHAARLGPLCTLIRAVPVITFDLGPGETAELPDLPSYGGPVIVLLGAEGAVTGKCVEQPVTVTVPAPGPDLRRACWEEALHGRPAPLDDIAARFLLPVGHIRRAASIAIAHAEMAGRNQVLPEDVRDASRALNRQALDSLAVRLEAEGSWDQLVLGQGTLAKLRELERRCRHREGLSANLGPAFGSAPGRGVRALLSGPSGTGKTLAARLLAAELEMDIYRMDLAAVVNKYIGETEKNLNQVLSRAEELDVILLLDEGDALLGRRSEIKSANDRYANLETNYLLQRLEHYDGIILITTNAGEYIDQAFRRRMDVLINFQSPQAEERLRIWKLHLPKRHRVETAYLREVADRCALTGGQIRGAAMLAALLAVDAGGPVRRAHLAEAVLSEYRKAGAICPLGEEQAGGAGRGGMSAFMNAMSARGPHATGGRTRR